MSKEEAMKYLITMLTATCFSKEFCIGETEKVREALEIAIEALEERIINETD